MKTVIKTLVKIIVKKSNDNVVKKLPKHWRGLREDTSKDTSEDITVKKLVKTLVKIL